MNKKNWLSGRDKELQELADQYEASLAQGTSCYMDADDLADLADWYAVNRKYDLAHRAVDYGLTLHPDSTALLVEKAYLFLDAQQREEARKVLQLIAEDTPEVKVLRANFLMADNRVAEAEALIDQIEEKDDLYNIIDVVYMYIDNGYAEKARPWIEQNLQRYADEEPFQAVASDYYYAIGNLEEAAIFYNKLIDRNPYAAPYWFGLARCYFDTQQFDKAIDACDYATVADDEFVEAYIIRGHAFYQLGNEDAALENYLKAKELGGLSQSYVDTFIGLKKFDAGEWAEALTYLERAISEKEVEDDSISMPVLYANIALCHSRCGHKEEARHYCHLSIDLDPTLPDGYLIEGYLNMADSNPEQGARYWAQAVKVSPTSYVWNEIANYAIELNMLPTALLAYEHVKELEPDYPQINEKLAALYLTMKEKEKFLFYNLLCERPYRAQDLEAMALQMEMEDEAKMAGFLRQVAKEL